MNVRKLLETALHKLSIECGYENWITLDGKKYRIGQMSYGDYFVEPYKAGKTERSEFEKGTLWLRFDGLEILQLFIDSKYLCITLLSI